MDENPIVNYRMTFDSSVCILRANSAIVDAMKDMQSGKYQKAYDRLYEIITHPGFDELDHAVISLEQKPN